MHQSTAAASPSQKNQIPMLTFPAPSRRIVDRHATPRGPSVGQCRRHPDAPPMRVPYAGRSGPHRRPPSSMWRGRGGAHDLRHGPIRDRRRDGSPRLCSGLRVGRRVRTHRLGGSQAGGRWWSVPIRNSDRRKRGSRLRRPTSRTKTGTRGTERFAHSFQAFLWSCADLRRLTFRSASTVP